jgi:hypothetical protein
MISLLNKLKPGTTISIKGKSYRILQHIVWWQAKCGENYDKYVLEDEAGDHDYRLFISGSCIGISHIFHYPFQEPMLKQIEFQEKKYNLTQDEFCIVKKSQGQEFYKVGDAEIWWDYASTTEGGRGLSLGRNWLTWEREDLQTEAIQEKDIQFLDNA